MPFTNPIRAQAWDDLITAVELWFADATPAQPDDNAPYGRFLMRGGVCWPDRLNEQDVAEGCIVLLGYNLDTDRAYLFADSMIVCIAHLIHPHTHRLLFQGLAPWFGKVWTTYVSDSFYSHQPEDICARWQREIRQELGIDPQPRFIMLEKPWGDVRNAETLIWDWITRRRISMLAEGVTGKAIVTHNRGKAEFLSPPLHALACCLAGTVRCIPEAKEALRSPAERIRTITNPLMLQHPRDWHTHED